MSGGSHNYIYHQIDQELAGAMRDAELDDLMKDISGLAHALEWYDSGDTSKEDYLAEVKAFKAKWFESSREERLKQYVNDKLEDLHKEIFSLAGADPAPPKEKEAIGMTNAQKLEKLGMYEVLVKILGKFEPCIVDTLSEAVHACPEHQDCKKCLGEWLAKEE